MRLGTVPLLPLTVAALTSAAASLARAAEGDVAVGGEFLLRIRVPASGLSVRQRVDAIHDRLAEILADTRIGMADVQVERARDGILLILVKRHPLVTVTPADGQANGLSAQRQAEIWARQVRKVLPQVNVRPNPATGQR